MQFAAIVLLSVGAAVLYGIARDMVVARVCIEYFTIAHPPIFRTTSPTLLGLGWGILSTWWAGLCLGVLLACAARVGNRPQLRAAFFIRPAGALLLLVACIASVAGFAAFSAATLAEIELWAPMYWLIPLERQPRFFAAICAQFASGASGLAGGLALIVWTWRVRSRADVERASSVAPCEGNGEV